MLHALLAHRRRELPEGLEQVSVSVILELCCGDIVVVFDGKREAYKPGEGLAAVETGCRGWRSEQKRSWP